MHDGHLGILYTSLNITQLRDSGLINCVAKEGYHFYELTTKGKDLAVQLPSLGSMGQIIGLHAIAFRFKLLVFKEFPLQETTTLRGWTLHRGYFKGCLIERTTKNLIIWPIPKGDRIRSSSSLIARDKARDKAIDIALYFKCKYDLQLGEPEEVKGTAHYAIELPELGLPKTSSGNGHNDHSLGHDEIEYPSAEKAQEFINLPQRVAQIEETIGKMGTLMAMQTQHQGEMATDIHFIAENYKSHVGVVVKLNKILSQKSLRSFV